MTKKAVCLLSGGLDSTTALYQALAEGWQVTALTIHYGQRHDREIDSARAIAQGLKVQHFVIPISLPWGGSALLDSSVAVPTHRDLESMKRGIPATYVPARNTIFLALAASLAETLDAQAIFIGANILDYSGYPDCRPEFLNALEKTLHLGTKAGQEGRRVQIKAPLLQMNKKEIVQRARDLKVPLEATWSCYQGKDRPCGVCDSCLLRAKGFHEAGVEDPLISSLSQHAAKL